MKKVFKIALIVLGVFAVISLIFGGGYLSKLSLNMHLALKGAAEKFEDRGQSGSGKLLRWCSSVVCFVPDKLAFVSDKIHEAGYSLIQKRIDKENQAVEYIRNLKEMKEELKAEEEKKEEER